MLQRAKHYTTGSKPPEQKSVGTCKRSKVRWNCLGAILSNSTCTAVVPINSTCRITFNITDRLAGFVRLCLELWISYSVSDALVQRDNRWSVWSGASFVMETTEIDGNQDVTSRTAVFQIEIDEENSTTQERSVEDDSFLETLSPLINSMRLFGLYFTRKPDDNVASSTSRQGYQSWNPGRIYATIMLLVACLNSLLQFAIFDGSETIGADLFTKIGRISSDLLITVLHSSYYVGSHTGSLDRIFRKENLSIANFSLKYSRRVKVVTVVSWTLVASCVIGYIYLIFTDGKITDPTILFVIDTLRVSKPCVNIIKAVVVALELQRSTAWVFTQAMNYITTFLLSPLFTTLFIPNFSMFHQFTDLS